MKMLIPIIVLFLFVFSCGAQDTQYGTEGKLIWDASIAYQDGTPYLSTDIVTYEVFRSTLPVANRNSPEVYLGSTEGLEMNIDFPDDEKEYSIAVRTRLITDEGQTILFSNFNWSDITEEGETTLPFTIKHSNVKNPSIPLQLYMGGM